MKQRKDSHAQFEPAEADIQKCAYSLWKEEGSLCGRDLDIWLKARELVRHHVPDRTRPGPRRRRRA